MTTESTLPRPHVTDPGLVAKALQRAVRHAILERRRAGNPIAAWRDGRARVVSLAEVALPPDPDDPTSDADGNRKEQP